MPVDLLSEEFMLGLQVTGHVIGSCLISWPERGDLMHGRRRAGHRRVRPVSGSWR
jgi:hypothetical protein